MQITCTRMLRVTEEIFSKNRFQRLLQPVPGDIGVNSRQLTGKSNAVVATRMYMRSLCRGHLVGRDSSLPCAYVYAQGFKTKLPTQLTKQIQCLSRKLSTFKENSFSNVELLSCKGGKYPLCDAIYCSVAENVVTDTHTHP